MPERLRASIMLHKWQLKMPCPRGYSLIEVLVSILLLSIGFLGTAGLQAAAIRATQQSAYQTMGLQLAADIADTLGVLAHDEALLPGFVFEIDYAVTPGTRQVANVRCHYAACGMRDFAAAEIDEWKMRMASTFPAARLRICRDDSAGEDAGQAYTWDCGGGGEGVPLVVKLGWKVKNPDGSDAAQGKDFPPSVVVPVASVS